MQLTRLSPIFTYLLFAWQIPGQTSTPPRYPENFLWGAAMSAHQSEGITDGGQFADWYPFEHTPGNILNGDTADIATDQWHRYPEDFLFAKAIGVNTLRTSIAWEKVEPSQGSFNYQAIEHYRRELEYMHLVGIRPMITLLHGTVPLWFQNRGGWTADDSPVLFAAYVEFVVRNLRDLCDLWITINEPMVLIGEGYLQGIIPPQIASTQAAINAAWNLARAHRLATSKIHNIQPIHTPIENGRLRGVGLVNSLDLYAPYDTSDPLDVEVTGVVIELSNWAFAKAAIYGQFEIGQILAQMLGGDLQQPSGPIDYPDESGAPVLDWIGVNYYTLSLVQLSPTGYPNFVAPPGPTTDIGRLIYPQGTEEILRDTASVFPGYPLVMTENGVSDAQDKFRPQFIRDTLHYLDLARFGHDGLPAIDVRGYYHWNLTDDFEWQYGYFSRYGLIAIDYAHNLARAPRASAGVYRSGILARQP